MDIREAYAYDSSGLIAAGTHQPTDIETVPAFESITLSPAGSDREGGPSRELIR